MAETAMSEVSATDKQHLLKLVGDLRRSNVTLQSENEMFKRYIGRLNAKDLHPQPGSEGRAQKPKMLTVGQEQLQGLTMDQKCTVVQQELDQMRLDLKKLETSSERVLDSLKVTLEEADIRLVEITKASHEFDRDMAKPLREEGSVTMGPEKVVRYFEEKIGAKEALVEKLRLKNASLRVQERKLRLQLEQENELGEALRKVDFEYLKIENSHYIKRIEERNEDLLHLKMMAGNTLRVLNSFKKKLENVTSESAALSDDIARRKDLLLKIKAETVQAEEERSVAEALNRKLRSQLADFCVPHVLDYVTTKMNHSSLEKSVHAWERKVDIAEMTTKAHSKGWNKLTMSSGPGTAIPH